MSLYKKIPALVSVDWLYDNKNNQDLIIFDASIAKATSCDAGYQNFQIPDALYFDLKNVFCETDARFPNTVPSELKFTKAVRNLGVNNNSIIVIYDDKGIYSSPRAWYLFKYFGFTNVAVLNGGLPAWKLANYPIQTKGERANGFGDFIPSTILNKIIFYQDIHKSILSNDQIIIDARSQKRFKGLVPEPRKGLRSGKIPNSINIPFTNMLNSFYFKSKKEIKKEFKSVNKTGKLLIFSCGSGITACILALAAELIGISNISVYDGSWTEFGSLEKDN